MGFQSYQVGSGQDHRDQNRQRWKPSNIAIPVLSLQSSDGKQIFWVCECQLTVSAIFKAG